MTRALSSLREGTDEQQVGPSRHLEESSYVAVGANRIRGLLWMRMLLSLVNSIMAFPWDHGRFRLQGNECAYLSYERGSSLLVNCLWLQEKKIPSPSICEANGE